MKISVIGLGKLGLCTAACFASAGHVVYGYDTNDHLRAELKARRNPINETGLSEQLESAWSNLHIVDGYEAALVPSDITLIIVPTPSLPDGRFTNEYLINALECLAPFLRVKHNFHIINIVSTVMPGSCDSILRPFLEHATGKKCGTDFGLTYNPEFIALGSVIRDFLNPDMVLIGTSDERSSYALRNLYSSICKTKPIMAVMSLINAEITKISLNCYVTMKISFANGLAAICEQVPGSDVDVITAAIGADSRVGNKYLKGGLGFGGPCFPRDNIAFHAFAKEHDVEAMLGKAVVSVNNSVPERIYKKISYNCKLPAKVALLGISYKANTHIIEESQSIILAELLCTAGYQVFLHDPKSLEAARSLLGDRAAYAIDPYECLVGSSAIALLTDWPEYHNLNWRRIATLVPPAAVVIDSWRIAKHINLSDFTYIPLGVGIV